MVDVFGGSRRCQGVRGPRGEDGATVDPTSSYDTYVKYINLRRKTINSICGIVKIMTNQKTYGNISSLLETMTTLKHFYWTYTPFQKDKYIAFQFQKPVWLNQIEFLVDRHTAWTAHFTWEYSDNGTTWKQIGNEYNKVFTSSMDPQSGKPYEILTFPQETLQERNTKHTHWRMHGLDGEFTDRPYVNTVFIHLTL